MSSRLVGLVLIAALLGGTARADKIDDLTRALMQDSSYKVRVQAALVLGKLKDCRAVPALEQALRDENETVRGVAASSLGQIGDASAKPSLEALSGDSSTFVRSQAKKALALFGGGGAVPAVRAGARFYVAVGFQGGKTKPELSQIVRDTLTRELGKLPDVTLSLGAGDPSAAQLAQRRMHGYIVDGQISVRQSPAGAQSQIDCDLKMFIATYPDRSIKVMGSQGASVQAGASEAESAKRDCLAAVAEAIRDDVGNFLRTVQ